MAVIEALGTVYCEADVASVEFDTTTGTIGTWEHLQIRLSSLSTGTTLQRGVIQFNSDTTATNYWRHYMQGTTTTPSAYGSNTFMWGYSPMIGSNPEYGCAVLDILDYRNGSKNTTVTSVYGQTGNGPSSPYVNFVSCMWVNPAAVTSITLLPLANSFLRGSEISLYGIQE